jgi:hypothetical protein
MRSADALVGWPGGALAAVNTTAPKHAERRRPGGCPGDVLVAVRSGTLIRPSGTFSRCGGRRTSMSAIG